MKAEREQNRSIGSLPVQSCLEETGESGIPRVFCPAGKSPCLEEHGLRSMKQNCSTRDRGNVIAVPK